LATFRRTPTVITVFCLTTVMLLPVTVFTVSFIFKSYYFNYRSKLTDSDSTEGFIYTHKHILQGSHRDRLGSW